MGFLRHPVTWVIKETYPKHNDPKIETKWMKQDITATYESNKAGTAILELSQNNLRKKKNISEIKNTR